MIKRTVLSVVLLLLVLPGWIAYMRSHHSDRPQEVPTPIVSETVRSYPPMSHEDSVEEGCYIAAHDPTDKWCIELKRLRDKREAEEIPR